MAETYVELGKLRGPEGERGPRGDAGPRGPEGPQGERGERGYPGTFHSAGATSIPAGQPAHVEMTGDELYKHAQFFVPRGLPGTNAVPSDEAVATYLAADDTETRAAADGLYAGRRGVVPVVNVLEYGAAGDDATDNTALLVDLFTRFAGAHFVFPRGVYHVNGTIDIPNAETRTVVELRRGAEVIQHGPDVTFRATGATEYIGPLTVNLARGASVASFDGSVDVQKGDRLLITSNDTFSGTADKYGSMFAVDYLVTGGAQLDSASHRGFDVSANGRVYKGLLHNGVDFVGKGRVRHVDSSNKSSLITLTLVSEPVVSGVELGPNGHVGVTVTACDGGVIDDVYLHDLRDDLGSGHVGYGINCGGFTRNLTVRGRAVKCRHAFTTNVGNVPGIGVCGEPNNIDVEMTTVNCTNKALDTHRAGFGIRLKVNNRGGFGAVQIRCDNAYVEGVSVGANGVDFATGSLHEVPAVFDGCLSSNLAGGATTSFSLSGPALLVSPSIYRAHKGVVVNADGVAVLGGIFQGRSRTTGTAVEINAKDTVVKDNYLRDFGTGVHERSGSNNTVTGQRYNNVSVSLDLLASYEQEVGKRLGAMKTSTPGALNRSIPVLDDAGAVIGYIPVSTSLA